MSREMFLPHHPKVDFPNRVKRQPAVQVNGAGHTFEDVTQRLGDLDVLCLLSLVLLDEVALLRHLPPVLSLDPHEPVTHILEARAEVFEELVELVPDSETREDSVVDQGGPQISQGAWGVESRILKTRDLKLTKMYI